MTSLFPLLFGLRARVPRRPYVVAGFALAALKFGLDFALVRGFTGESWSPLGYVVPSVVLRETGHGPAPVAMYVLLALSALPFLWIGLSMSVRRAADAGLTPWAGVLFVVPFVNYALMITLALLPSKADAAWHAAPRPGESHAPAEPQPLSAGVRAALLGLLGSIGVGLAMLWLSVYGLELYGAALFFATPFAMGTVSSAVYNRAAPRGLLATLALALVGTAMTGSIVLLFALEGVLCLAMAFPIAAVIALAGAFVAWAIAAGLRETRPRPVGAAFLFILPLLAFGESRLETPTLRHVTTTIEVDAPPEVVWPHIVGFSELPPPPEWFFRLGVAHPRRARIEGTGVGAVRHCEFSTGPFVEPITVWDPPRRLAFDVTAQPPSMNELSPYHRVNAPHLEGYMVSRGGEFRLVPLPGGRTRIEGTTHYTLAIYPELYWVGFAEVLLHAIHWRVLTHIRVLSEHAG